MRSYTISPLDPKAKLFYNPTFNNDELLRSSLDASALRWVRGRCQPLCLGVR